VIIFIGPNRQRGNVLGFKAFDDAPHTQHKTYNWLFRTHTLPAATYIFTFLDRLHPRERRLAAKIYRHINAAGVGFKALNDPAKAKNRLGLLQALHAAKINDFNVYRANETPKPARFPVFLRFLSVSLPPVSDLLFSQAELDDTIYELAQAGEPLDDLIVIEYCAEPFEKDYFVKLSAYRIDNQYMLDLFLFDQHWYVKYGDVDTMPPDFAETEAKYLRENQWIDDAKQVFDLAHIEYGRVDFSLVNNRPQFYEINFHPQFTLSEYRSKHPIRLENAKFAARRRMDAMKSLVSKVAAKPIANIVDTEITAFRFRPWRNFAPQRY
jgi:hypothetical protein